MAQLAYRGARAPVVALAVAAGQRALRRMPPWTTGPAQSAFPPGTTLKRLPR